jgi:hypothetical protein
MLDPGHLPGELTVAEKASLTSGSAFWYTTPVERLGIRRIMVSDGPHGLRAQPGDSDHVGLGGSLPATLLPHRLGDRLRLESRSVAPHRPGPGSGGQGLQPLGHPRPGDQHEPVTAVRAELRILRGPVPGR